jgi:hypothetical protein
MGACEVADLMRITDDDIKRGPRGLFNADTGLSGTRSIIVRRLDWRRYSRAYGPDRLLLIVVKVY